MSARFASDSGRAALPGIILEYITAANDDPAEFSPLTGPLRSIARSMSSMAAPCR